MDRGVVVGGLLICGSFLLAAALNRSAMKESVPGAPVMSEAPITPVIESSIKPGRADQSATTPARCATLEQSASADVSNETLQGDLPGNGLKPCPQ